jgi:hypothetical protein
MIYEASRQQKSSGKIESHSKMQDRSGDKQFSLKRTVPDS